MKLNIVSIAGGLGNQMFQYAFYLSLKTKDKDKSYTKVYVAKYTLHNGYELETVFDIKRKYIPNLIIGFLKSSLKKWTFKIQDIKEIGTFINVDSNSNTCNIVYYSGYWQSEKYFDNNKQIVRKLFCFKKELISDKNKFYIQLLLKQNSVSIHIRRGDYITNAGANKLLGGMCDLKYYENAIVYIKKYVTQPMFYVFSDDMEWVKLKFNYLKNVEFVDWNVNVDSWQDMLLMSKCKHNIIANSSFSWWGAWLNENPQKIVIAPKKWFNSHESIDIVPERWVRI